jgi:uncharacterized protein YgiM (DUF1202 family)
MWIDNSGQIHRDNNTNSSNTRNVQPNRTYQNTTSDNGAKKWIIVIVCIVAFIIIIRQCNTSQSNQSQNTATNQSQNTIIQSEFATVKSDALNVRASPSADSGIRDKIYRTNKVEIIERYNNGWVKINYNGRSGYVNGRYLLR